MTPPSPVVAVAEVAVTSAAAAAALGVIALYVWWRRRTKVVVGHPRIWARVAEQLAHSPRRRLRWWFSLTLMTGMIAALAAIWLAADHASGAGLPRDTPTPPGVADPSTGSSLARHLILIVDPTPSVADPAFRTPGLGAGLRAIATRTLAALDGARGDRLTLIHTVHGLVRRATFDPANPADPARLRDLIGATRPAPRVLRGTLASAARAWAAVVAQTTAARAALVYLTDGQTAPPPPPAATPNSSTASPAAAEPDLTLTTNWLVPVLAVDDPRPRANLAIVAVELITDAAGGAATGVTVTVAHTHAAVAGRAGVEDQPGDPPRALGVLDARVSARPGAPAAAQVASEARPGPLAEADIRWLRTSDTTRRGEATLRWAEPIDAATLVLSLHAIPPPPAGRDGDASGDHKGHGRHFRDARPADDQVAVALRAGRSPTAAVVGADRLDPTSRAIFGAWLDTLAATGRLRVAAPARDAEAAPIDLLFHFEPSANDPEAAADSLPRHRVRIGIPATLPPAAADTVQPGSVLSWSPDAPDGWATLGRLPLRIAVARPLDVASPEGSVARIPLLMSLGRPLIDLLSPRPNAPGQLRIGFPIGPTSTDLLLQPVTAAVFATQVLGLASPSPPPLPPVLRVGEPVRFAPTALARWLADTPGGGEVVVDIPGRAYPVPLEAWIDGRAGRPAAEIAPSVAGVLTVRAADGRVLTTRPVHHLNADESAYPAGLQSVDELFAAHAASLATLLRTSAGAAPDEGNARLDEDPPADHDDEVGAMSVARVIAIVALVVLLGEGWLLRRRITE